MNLTNKTTNCKNLSFPVVFKKNRSFFFKVLMKRQYKSLRHFNFFIVFQQQIYCNFGWSLHGADINADGFKDVIIGSPFAPAGGEQRGAIHMIYSSTKYNGKFS